MRERLNCLLEGCQRGCFAIAFLRSLMLLMLLLLLLSTLVSILFLACLMFRV